MCLIMDYEKVRIQPIQFLLSFNYYFIFYIILVSNKIIIFIIAIYKISMFFLKNPFQVNLSYISIQF